MKDNNMLYTAKGYEGCEWDGEPFEENGKMYVNVIKTCGKCGGTGKIPYYFAIDKGLCWECRGLGYSIKKARLYTAAQKAYMLKVEEEKQKVREERKRKANEEKYVTWLKNHGFNEDNLTWCIFGDDTYAIKDWLKEQGCKFDPILKWHCNEPIALPAGYGTFEVSLAKLGAWDSNNGLFEYFPEAKNTIDKMFKQHEGPSLSEYMGEVGERLREITVSYKTTKGFSSKYGWTNIYTFEHENNVLVWFSAKEIELQKGDTLLLTGTVKKHEEFRGVKTTQLSRCILTKIGE